MKKIIGLLMAMLCVVTFSTSAFAIEPRRGSQCPLCEGMGFHQTLRYEHEDTGSPRTCRVCGYTTNVMEVTVHYDGYCTSCGGKIIDTLGTKYMEARCPAHGDIM